MATTITPDTVQFGVSQYTGQRSVRYTACPHCGSDIHRYPRMAHPHGHQSYAKCADGCGFGMWEHEERERILDVLLGPDRKQRERQLTSVSGYHACPEPPQANACPFCGIGPCVAMCEPPADDAQYMRAWRAGAFDDELAVVAEDLFYVGYERLLGGAE